MKTYFKLFLLLNITFFNQLANSQINFFKTDLDKKKFKEISGLEKFGPDYIAHNDSGAKPILYKMNSKGEIIKIISLNTLRNIDWEDISADKFFIYIADIGNNFGDRKDLKIYKVNKKTFKMDSIELSYKFQTKFQSNYINEFDAEAIAVFDENILIFSKNRLKQITEIYKVPKNIKNISLAPVDYLDVDGLITGADYNKKLNLMVLSGYSMGNVKQYLYILRDFKLPYNSKLMEIIKLPKEYDNTQIESIKILSSNELLVASEAENEGNPFILKITFNKNNFLSGNNN
jgi:hypothetical protein